MDSLPQGSGIALCRCIVWCQLNAAKLGPIVLIVEGQEVWGLKIGE